MSNNYANLTVAGVSQNSLCESFDANAISAYISPNCEEYIVIFPELHNVLTAARIISQMPGARVLAVINSDDDDLLCAVFNSDREVALAFTSNYRSYKEIKELCELFDAPEVERDLVAAIRSSPASATALHSRIVRTLGLPAWSVGFGFEYIRAGEVPPNLPRSDLKRCGLASSAVIDALMSGVVVEEKEPEVLPPKSLRYTRKEFNYDNITVFAPADSIIAALSRAPFVSYLSTQSSPSDAVVVFPACYDDPDRWIARILNCVTLSVSCSNSHLIFITLKSGKRLFGWDHGGGGAKATDFCRVFDCMRSELELARLLDIGRGQDCNFLELHRSIVGVLRLPELAVGLGYFEIKSGNLPVGVRADGFVHFHGVR